MIDLPALHGGDAVRAAHPEVSVRMDRMFT